jgi:hypothetical protein
MYLTIATLLPPVVSVHSDAEIDPRWLHEARTSLAGPLMMRGYRIRPEDKHEHKVSWTLWYGDVALFYYVLATNPHDKGMRKLWRQATKVSVERFGGSVLANPPETPWLLVAGYYENMGDLSPNAIYMAGTVAQAIAWAHLTCDCVQAAA